MANKAFVTLSGKYPRAIIALEISPIQKVDTADFLAAIKRVPSKWKRTTFEFSQNKSSIYQINSVLPGDYQTQFKVNLATLDRDNAKTQNPKIAFKVENLEKWTLVFDDQTENISFFLNPFSVNETTNVASLSELLFFLVTGSPVFYTPTFQRKIAGEINNFLGSNVVSGRIDLSKVTSLSTLTFNDLKLGGLISLQGEDFYSVTYKPNGTRVFVYINHEGVFLLGTTSFIWVSKDVSAYPSNGKVSEDNLPMLLEGEFVPRDKRRNNGTTFKEKYLVEVYDCLVFAGKNITSLPLYERLEWREHFVGLINRDVGAITRIVCKKHYPFKNADQFYQTMQGLITNRETLPNYETDGFIFTPSGDYLSSKIFKWKPLEQNTIDLLYQGGKWLQRGEKGDLVEMKIDVEGEAREGIIYELQPLDSGSKWRIYQERTNRRMPNNYQQIQSILVLLRDPILETTLMGQDLELYKRFHRRMKGVILSNARGGSLLDIGSGRLGDLRFWKDFEVVYALEPSEEYNIEGKRRLGGHKGVKVIQIQGNGEDKIEIPPVDNISMMFSLSFFGEKNKLQNLLHNVDVLLKPGGFLLLAVFEGDLLESAFENWPKLANPKTKEEVLVFPAGASVSIIHNFTSRNPYGFDIETTLAGTIVSEQKESPVFMRKLLPLLAKIDIFPVKTWIFDQETFLNPVELYLTRLFSGWVFRRKGVRQISEAGKKVISEKTPEVKLPGSSSSEVKLPGSSSSVVRTPRVSKPITLRTPKSKKVQTCQILPISEVQNLADFMGYPIQRTGVPSDGGCLIHSILLSADEEYQGMNSKDRTKRVQSFRKQLAEDLTVERFNELHISKIGPTTVDDDEEEAYTHDWLVKRLENPSIYLGNEEVQYLSEYFEVNMIFFKCKEGTTPAEIEEYKATQEDLYDKSWIYIMILWVGGNHFEPLSINLGKGFVSFVKPKHSFIKNFVK